MKQIEKNAIAPQMNVTLIYIIIHQFCLEAISIHLISPFINSLHHWCINNILLQYIILF